MIGAIIASIAISLVGMGINEVARHYGAKTANQLYNQCKVIYNKIAQNENLLAKLQDAYANKDSKLMTSLINSTGLGARAQRILSAAKENQSKFNDDRDKITKKNAELQSQYNKTNSAAENAKTGSIASIVDAKNVIKQNTQGGITK